VAEPFEHRRSVAHERRRRRRGVVRWLVVALALTAVAAVAVFAWSMLGGEPEQTAARPASSPSIAPVTTGLEDVRTTSGARVRLPFRVSMDGAETAIVTLLVTHPDGTPVRRLLRRVTRPVNVDLAWTGTLALKAGSYRYVVYATVDGRQQRVAVPAKLVVEAPAFPGDEAVAAAIAWAKGRSGTPGVAVVTTDGEVHGLRLTKQYASYSLSKAMMLVAYLRAHATVSDAMRDTLERMIEQSDNAAANVLFSEIGGAAGLTRLAKTVGMKRFSPGGGWMSARVTPADQARFFVGMEKYIPAKHRALARELLSGVTSRQRWGIVAAAGPLGWKVYFKGGWSSGNVYMTQAARLQRGKRVFAVAVLTEGNPDWTYGFGTIKGVAGILLGRQPTGAYLAQVLE
jgi:hypothetical protein